MIFQGNLANSEVGAGIPETFSLGFGTFPRFHHDHLPNLNAGVLMVYLLINQWKPGGGQAWTSEL